MIEIMLREKREDLGHSCIEKGLSQVGPEIGCWILDLQGGEDSRLE